MRSILALAVLIITFSAAQLFYRLSLPTEGWSLTRDTTGSGMRLIFDRNLSGLPSPLQPGDVLVAINGQPVERILAEALTLNPQRPANWAVGQTVIYSVTRGGVALNLEVRLLHLTAWMALRSALRNLLTSPGPLLMVLIAFFVFFRDPRSAPARLLLLFSAAVFSSDGISQVVSGSNVLGPAEMFARGAYWPAQIVDAILWPFLIAPFFLHLLLSFPGSRPRLHRFGWLGPAVIYGLMPLLTLIVGLVYLGRPLDFWQAWNAVSYIDFVGVLAAAIAIMSYTLLVTRDAAGHAQAAWVAGGTILACLGALSGSGVIMLGLTGIEFLLAWTATRLLLLGFPVAVAIAILRYRLFDIDIIIHNTVIYAIISGLLGGFYLVSVVLLQFIFIALTGARSPVAIVLSTLAIAALFVPLRRRVQETIDRRMYHHRYDTERILASFSAAVRDEVDLDHLSTRLMRAAEETLQPENVSLWLRPAQHDQQR